MSSQVLPPLEVDAGAQVPPELLTGLIAIVFSIIPWLLPLTFVSIGVVAGAIALCAVVCYRAGWLTAMRRIHRIQLSGTGTWLLTDRRGDTLVGQLRADSRILTHVLWLRWDTVAGRRQALVIRGRDAHDPVRRLIVRVRFPGRGQE